MGGGLCRPSGTLDITVRLSRESVTNHLEQDYELGNIIGKGAFGVVYAGTHRLTKQPAAVKVLDRGVVRTQSIDREETALRQVGYHPNIVDFLGAYRTPAAASFVFERMRGGMLYDRLINRGAYSEHQARNAFLQLVKAIAHCHSRRVVHCDVKLENVLLLDDEEHSIVKLSDFGLSQVLPKNGKLRRQCGTWAYAAPEMYDPAYGYYNEKFDMWSFGVILYIVLSGFYPFDPEGTLHVNEIRDNIMKAENGGFRFDQPEWRKVSPKAVDLIKGLLRRDPKRRLSAEESYMHPWFKDRRLSQEPIGPHIHLTLKRTRAILRRKLKATFQASMFMVSTRKMSQAMIPRPLEVAGNKLGRSETSDSAPMVRYSLERTIPVAIESSDTERPAPLAHVKEEDDAEVKEDSGHSPRFPATPLRSRMGSARWKKNHSPGLEWNTSSDMHFSDAMSPHIGHRRTSTPNSVNEEFGSLGPPRKEVRSVPNTNVGLAGPPAIMFGTIRSTSDKHLVRRKAETATAVASPPKLQQSQSLRFNKLQQSKILAMKLAPPTESGPVQSSEVEEGALPFTSQEKNAMQRSKIRAVQVRAAVRLGRALHSTVSSALDRINPDVPGEVEVPDTKDSSQLRSATESFHAEPPVVDHDSSPKLGARSSVQSNGTASTALDSGSRYPYSDRSSGGHSLSPSAAGGLSPTAGPHSIIGSVSDGSTATVTASTPTGGDWSKRYKNPLPVIASTGTSVENEASRLRNEI